MKKKLLDSQKTLTTHRKIIRNKPFLKRIYKDFYLEFKKIRVPNGPLIELGSGAGFIKKIMPMIITSDIERGPDIDQIFSATKLPFKSDAIAAFYMLDTFHHIKYPEKALQEMERCLKNSGKIIMIEPYNSSWGRFIYQKFHHENFDPRGGWEIKGTGRLSNANGAIPWIVFVRDKDIFEKKFPNLKIKKVTPHTPLRYLLSGGLSKPQLIPSFLYSFIVFLEKILSPFNSFLCMFVTIELQKFSQKQTGK